MNREIKFRAWKDGKEMDFDYISYEVEYGEVFIITAAGCDSYLDAVDNCIIEQYTGLKDKNGIEIYEGDVLKWNTGMMSGTSEVVYEPACFCLSNYFLEDNQLANPLFTQMYCEVIGNIHQNPELQKV